MFIFERSTLLKSQVDVTDLTGFIDPGTFWRDDRPTRFVASRDSSKSIKSEYKFAWRCFSESQFESELVSYGVELNGLGH